MNANQLLTNPKPSRLQSYFRRSFGCDVRSLALFRMVVAVLVLIDLAIRSKTIKAMFTDEGYFTRDIADQFYRMASGSEIFSYWSLHKLSGAYEFQVFLFLLTATGALLLLVGWKTRIASVVVWVLVASMQARNPLVNTSGDMLLKMLLFWSMFLPLGRVWSIDSGRKAPQLPKRIANLATAGIILQLCFMYWFTGFSKCNDIWFRGEALDYVLNLDIYARDFAQALLQFPWMMKIVTWATVYGEIILPFLLFIPLFQIPMRWLNIASFWMMHLMIALSMAIGLFSYISMVGWLPLLPGSFWNWPIVRNVAGMLDKIFARKAVIQSQNSKSNFAYRNRRNVVHWRIGARLLTNVVCSTLIVFCLFWNLGNIDTRLMPRQLTMVGAGLNLDQHFRMFDVPPQYSPWFVYEAELKNGVKLDVFRNRPVDFERPASVRLTIPDHHWRKLHRNLTRPELAQFRTPLVEYAVKIWNESHSDDQQIVYLKLTCFLDKLGPQANVGDQVVQVWGEHGRSFNRTFDQFQKDFESGVPF